MQHNSSQSADIPRSHSKLCKSFISKLWSKSGKSLKTPKKADSVKGSLQNHFSKNREHQKFEMNSEIGYSSLTENVTYMNLYIT
jgi:hypothetical protein